MFCLCPTCKHRCELPDLFEKKGYKHGVEVGVLNAQYSVPLLSRWSGFLHLIDPWEAYPEYVDDPVRTHDHNHNFHVAMTALSAFALPGTFSPPGATTRLDWKLMKSPRFRVWREKNSSALADRIGMVDFAYIDGNHAFKYVMDDLRIWWPRIKPGGTLAGHDLFQVEHPGVTEAVVLFANEHKATVHIVPGKDGCPCGEGGVPSWYLCKGDRG